MAIRKRVVRVLVYDGPVGWVNDTLEKSHIKGLWSISGDVSIQETVVTSVVYDDTTPLPEGE